MNTMVCGVHIFYQCSVTENKSGSSSSCEIWNHFFQLLYIQIPCVTKTNEEEHYK